MGSHATTPEERVQMQRMCISRRYVHQHPKIGVTTQRFNLRQVSSLASVPTGKPWSINAQIQGAHGVQIAVKHVQ